MSQIYAGEIRNGVVVFDEGTSPLPEGTRVRVEAAVNQASEGLSEILLELAGKAKGLPADLAEQHDHYIHGTPKR